MAHTQKEKVTQEMKVKGNQLVDRVRGIIEEGNARRISIRKEGRSLIELPLSVGVGGATAALLISPMLAAVGAVAALVSDVEVVVERDVRKSDPLQGAPDVGATGTGAGTATTPEMSPSAGATGTSMPGNTPSSPASSPSSPSDKSLGNPSAGTSPKDPLP